VSFTDQLSLISLKLYPLVRLSVDLMTALTSCELKQLHNSWKHKSLRKRPYCILWVFITLNRSL